MKEKILSDGTEIFNAQLDKEGQDIVIGGVSKRAIIHESYNPLNEFKEERKIMCLPSVALSRGSIIEAEGTKFLVISQVDDKEVYLRGKMIECNCTLHLKVDGIVHDIPTYVSTIFLVNDWVNTTKLINLPDGKISARVSNNSITSQISYNTKNRFIIGNTAWHVLNVDSITQDGIINLTLERESINMELDSVSLEVADYWKDDYTVTILNGTTASFSTAQTLQLNVQVTNLSEVVANPVITYSSSDITTVTVSSAGLLAGLKTGSVTITASYAGINASILVTVVSGTQHNLTLDISGLSKVKVGSSSVYSYVIKDNGVATVNVATWYLTTTDGVSLSSLAVITSVDAVAKTCTVQTNSKLQLGKFWLWAKNTDESLVKHVEIQIVARF